MTPMTPEQLAACVQRLIAYFPGDWDPQRQAVWAAEMAALDYTSACTAITAMARTERFPTVAAFNEAAHPKPPSGPISIDGCLFLEGTGWVGGRRPDDPNLTAIESPADAPRARSSIQDAREAMAKSEAGKAKAARQDPEPDPEPEPAAPPVVLPRSPMAGLLRQAVPQRPEGEAS